MVFKEEDHDFYLTLTVKDKEGKIIREDVVEARSLSWMEENVMVFREQHKQMPETHDFDLTLTIKSKETGTTFLEEVIKGISLNWIELSVDILQGKDQIDY